MGGSEERDGDRVRSRTGMKILLARRYLVLDQAGPERAEKPGRSMGAKVWPSHRRLLAIRDILSKRSVLATPARMEKTRCSLIRLQRIPPDGKTVFW